jgi:uncharacterized PurR-regulated membrane protein YhhQ (DUF165 family)
MLTVAYILAIAAINIGFMHVPLLPTPWGDLWPPLSIAVGFVFVLRDFAQREVGHGVLLAMLAGAALSWWLAAPFVAIASATAFLISELADWAVYSWTRKSLPARILWSSALGTPIDSAVFLAMIGQFTWSGVALMTLSKMLGALVVARALQRRELQIRPAENNSSPADFTFLR